MHAEKVNGPGRPDQPVDQPTARIDDLQGEVNRLRGSFARCKKAERELQAANRALKALSRCIEAMTHAADEKKLLDAICHIVTDISGYRMAWIGYAENDAGKSVRPMARSGYEEGYLETASITWSEADPEGRGPTGTAIRTGEPCLIKDVVTDPRFEPWRAEALKRGFKSVLGLPLCQGGSTYGALTIYSDQPDAYDSEEVALLSELASELAYGIVALRDRSERARAEKALEESKAQAELYLDLMGHDINNMNQVATGFLELALGKLSASGRLDVGDAALITRPVEALMSSSALIRNVRKLQKENSGQLAATIQNVNDVLLEVCEEFRKVPGRRLEIEFQRSSECNVRANNLLKDVFTNIVGNAVKHSTGPLIIRIRHYCAERPGAKTCVVEIEDNGPGIPDQLKSALFPVSQGTPRKGVTRGLGLYIVRTLVSDFGGKVRVEDRVPGDYSQGCRFVMELPAAGG
jgi:signal transduction histidine kinase